MAEATCVLCDALKRIIARGLCGACYQHAKRAGTLDQFRRARKSPTEALTEAKANETAEGCWPWPLVQASTGYPQPVIGADGRGHKAYVVVYEDQFGPVPEGLTLDHLCHTRSTTCAGGPSCLHRRCVRPDHLELATALEQAQRRVNVTSSACSRGHERTDVNTRNYTKSDGYTVRICRDCCREDAAKRRAS